MADHGLEFSGIAVDLWSFKKPGPSILDENPTPYMAAFLGFTVFGADLGIKTIRVDAVEPPDFFQTSGMDPKLGMDRIVTVWDKCSKIAADHGMNADLGVRAGLPVQQAVGGAGDRAAPRA